jgi:ubiquinone/menaquinone biosynthesis C-methylase UbiE
MSNLETWQLAHDAALAYERDFVPAIFAQWPPVLVEIVGIEPDDRVLDVACGTGILAREVASLIGPKCVTGLDINAGMLAVARSLAPSIDWRQGDAERLPFADAIFDVVVSQFALMFFPDRVAALREMRRVLAPRGRLALAVCGPISRAPGYAALARILRREVSAEAAAMVEGYFALGEEAELHRLCTTAGFDQARTSLHPGWARFASVDEFIRIEVKGSPLAGLVDETRYSQVLTAARREFADYRDPQGRVAMRLDATIVTAPKR